MGAVAEARSIHPPPATQRQISGRSRPGSMEAAYRIQDEVHRLFELRAAENPDAVQPQGIDVTAESGQASVTLPPISWVVLELG